MLNKILEHIKKDKLWEDERFYLNYEPDLLAVNNGITLRNLDGADADAQVKQ